MKIGYRPDLDGLRALSILLVIGFHVGLPGADGGFVGVDVFFVISGFLITHLLLQDLRQNGTISLPGFYSRRARRILPAFCVVAISVLVLSVFVLTPINEQQSLAKWTIASAAFVSNIFFALRTPGYFEPGIELNPMLHTWSLAVEEQFYLVWPLLLLAITSIAERFRLAHEAFVSASILGMVLVSLTCCIVLTGVDSAAAFYSTTSRAWELGMGALLAVRSGQVAQLLVMRERSASLIGIACILVAAVAYDSDSRFPGPAAILPCLGTMLVLAAGINESRGGRLAALAARPVVHLGKLSYSWYLWHWPLLALVRSAFPASQVLAVAAIVLALGLAAITYALVEHPIRRGQRLPASRATTLAVSLSACFGVSIVSAAMWAWAQERAASDRRYQVLNRAAGDIADGSPGCETSGRFVELTPVSACSLGARSASHWVVAWGDSHARHLVPALSESALNSGVGLLQRTRSSCLPLPEHSSQSGRDKDSSCARFNGAVLDELARLARERKVSVVLSGNWLWANWRYQPHASAAGPFSRSFVGFREQNDRSGEFEQRLRTTLDKLDALNLHVVVVAPFAELPRAVPTCLVRNSPTTCGRRLRAESDMNQAARTTIARVVADYPRARMWMAVDVLCSPVQCKTNDGEEILFRDRSHLTTAGALMLKQDADAQLRWLTSEETSFGRPMSGLSQSCMTGSKSAPDPSTGDSLAIDITTHVCIH